MSEQERYEVNMASYVQAATQRLNAAEKRLKVRDAENRGLREQVQAARAENEQLREINERQTSVFFDFLD